MIEIKDWMRLFTNKIEQTFANRIDFIGLQGSYARNEATENSDIDVVVILDKVSFKDLKEYDAAISGLPHREKICGFIAGKSELLNWEKSDLFQFYYDTLPVLGNIDYLFPLINKKDVISAIHTGACNLYHMCGHNIIHEKSESILRALYKSAVFIIQAVCYLENKKYIKTKTELLTVISTPEKDILKNYLRIKDLKTLEQNDFESISEKLFIWSAVLIEKYRH